MVREKVESSNVSSVGYDSNTETLEVEFNTGAVYQYFGVPKTEADGLVSASSVGSYLGQNIKNKYPYEKVS